MITAVVPVKRMCEAKSRLATLLSPEERTALVVALVNHTVAALAGSGVVDCITVVTPERQIFNHVNASRLADAGDLNRSLLAAAEWATSRRARTLLVVPADLPLLTGEDIRVMAESADTEPCVAIAPTHDGGTGALLLSPPGVIAPEFGAGSYQRHIQATRKAEVSLRLVRREAFYRDLDTPEDLESLRDRLPTLALGGATVPPSK